MRELRIKPYGDNHDALVRMALLKTNPGNEYIVALGTGNDKGTAGILLFLKLDDAREIRDYLTEAIERAELGD